MSLETSETPRGAENSKIATGPPNYPLWSAWLLLGLFTLLVLTLGGESFSAVRSYRGFAAFVHFFRPEATGGEIWYLFLWARKLAHALEYGLLALFAFRAARLSLESPLGRIALLAGLFTALVATADEVRQSALGSRTGSPMDVGIDVVSACVALALLLLLRENRLGAARTSRSAAPGS